MTHNDTMVPRHIMTLYDTNGTQWHIVTHNDKVCTLKGFLSSSLRWRWVLRRRSSSTAWHSGSNILYSTWQLYLPSNICIMTSDGQTVYMYMHLHYHGVWHYVGVVMGVVTFLMCPYISSSKTSSNFSGVSRCFDHFIASTQSLRHANMNYMCTKPMTS